MHNSLAFVGWSAAAFYSRDWFAGDVIMSTGVLYGLDLGVAGRFFNFFGACAFTTAYFLHASLLPPVPAPSFINFNAYLV